MTSDGGVRRPTAGGDGEERLERPAASNEKLRELTELTGQLLAQVGGELDATRAELSGRRLEAEKLRERLEALEREHRRMRDGYAELQEQVAELGNQCVVMERLHGALQHAEVLAAVQDVVINVIGSEELAVFVPSRCGRVLEPAQSFGVESRGLCPVTLGSGAIGRAAAERQAWVVGDGSPPAEFPDLTACVPLVADDRLVGVLAIWRMLPHKPVFGESDRRILELLARHAGTALHLTSLRCREEPLARAV